jgi:hypothetical protein
MALMSSDPGYIQRAIMGLSQNSGPEDVGWTTSWLCEHIYGGNSNRSKRAANYLAFIKLACIRLWLRTYECTA